MKPHRLATLLLAASLLAILAATLTSYSPAGGQPGGVLRFDWSDTADFARNVVLFAPLGLSLSLRGWRWWQAGLAGVLLSVALELGQLSIPGRYVSPTDIVADTLGATAGAALRQSLATALRAGGVRLERWALAVHLAAAGALVAAPWLAQPTPRTPPYFGHLVPDLPHFSPYAGRVDGASIDGHVVPHGRVPGSAVLEARLAGDFALSFHLRTAAPPTGLAALVMLTDAGSHEILLVGVDGDDLVVHQRTRARELGLEKARLRADHALRGVEPGTSLEIGLTRRGDDFALAVDGTPVAHFALTLGGGWRWLAPGWRLPAALRRGLDALWMGLLWMAVGVFHGAAPRGRVLALGLLAIAVGIPAVSLLGPSPAAEWLGAALGLVAGLWLWRALAGHVAGETSSSGSPAASPSAPPR